MGQILGRSRWYSVPAPAGFLAFGKTRAAWAGWARLPDLRAPFQRPNSLSHPYSGLLPLWVVTGAHYTAIPAIRALRFIGLHSDLAGIVRYPGRPL